VYTPAERIERLLAVAADENRTPSVRRNANAEANRLRHLEREAAAAKP
jgi:hypothetical protein